MSEDSTEAVQKFNIGMVSRLSGLRIERIRAWERRHAVVAPQRGEGGHRLYTAADVDRLRLLRALTDDGYSIGAIAGWTMDQLRGAVGEKSSHETARQSEFVTRSLEAIRSLNGDRLRQELTRAVQDLGPSRAVRETIEPLLVRLGEGWRDGSLRPMHEHLATATLRSMPTLLGGNQRLPSRAPRMLTATPTGQHHELGAAIVSAAARWSGWRVTHLGPDLPASDLAHAREVSSAAALALSITYPLDDPDLCADLLLLRDLVGDRFPILVGGRAAQHYAQQLPDGTVTLVSDLDELQRVLDDLRMEATPDA
ncbi:MAG: MerR family transcriptional regulator [Acidobacteriota bacterium]